METMMRASRCSTLVVAQRRNRAIIKSINIGSSSNSITMPNFRPLWIASAAAILARGSTTEAFTAGKHCCEAPTPAPPLFASSTSKTARQIRIIPFSSHQQLCSTTRLYYSGRGEAPPPDFTIVDDEDDDNNNNERDDSSTSDSGTEETATVSSSAAPAQKRPRLLRRPPARAVIAPGTASWVNRNAQFVGGTTAAPADEPAAAASPSSRTRPQQQQQQQQQQQPSSFGNGHSRSSQRASRAPPRNSAPRREGGVRTFREDFRGTRVFVSGLPEHCTWQELKDHFRSTTAGDVVFASVSLDRGTGRSKGHGIVQFETTEQAATAIAIMRNHPLEGHTLFVRPDIQEAPEDRRYEGGGGGGGNAKGPTPPSRWKCANSDEDAAALPDERRRAIRQLLRARDQARFRRNYDASDAMREELKQQYGVHLDDRSHLWWTSAENEVPDRVREVKGDGRWGAPPAWRQISTTPENDACVDPDLVEGLLRQRDAARRERDFATADRLLERARTAPDGDLALRIHDESRTWRVWTEAPPPPRPPRSDTVARLSPEEQCIAIVREHEPEKLKDIRTLLAKFPGREYNILKKIKDKYLQ